MNSHPPVPLSNESSDELKMVGMKKEFWKISIILQFHINGKKTDVQRGASLKANNN